MAMPRDPKPQTQLLAPSLEDNREENFTGHAEKSFRLSSSERHQLLNAFNKTDQSYPQICIHEIFEKWAEKFPASPAVVFEENSITYGELNSRSNRLAHHLQKLGVRPETLVGICVERGPLMIVGILGILKAGGAYVPVDPVNPPGRLQFILKDSGVSLLLTQETLLSKMSTEIPSLCLDRDWDFFAPADSNPSCEVAAENLAYVIYTSGSTGKPKGVLLEHRGLSNLAAAEAKAYGVDSASRVLQFASFGFDTSVSEIFMSLVSGATLCIASSKERMPGPDLASLLKKERISVATLPPAALGVLPDDDYPDLASIISAGSACTWRLVEKWGTGRRFFNAYGPTEITVCATIEECEQNKKSPSIGRPQANRRVYILDEQQRLLPLGRAGEIYVGGIGVARGYLNRPELTREKFLPDPFSAVSGARMYRTGDMAHWLPDGKLEYLGRNDHQVKLRGFRIEVGEIESRFVEYPKVNEAAVMVREDRPGEKRLVGYIIPNAPVDIPELKQHLRDFLPEYMVPTAIVVVKAWPLTLNGKIDREALPQPDYQTNNDHFVAPATPTEIALTETVASVLGLDQVSLADNFFQLGGDSISLIQVVAEAKTAGFQIPVRQFFETQTLAQLAGFIRTSRGIKAEESLVTGLAPLTPGQRRFFQEQKTAEHPFLFLSLKTELDAKILQQSLSSLVFHHDALRMRFEQNEDGWQQYNAAPDEMQPLDLPIFSLPFDDWTQNKTVTESEWATAQRTLGDPHRPLIRAALFVGRSQKRLMIVIHRLVSDRLTWKILLQDLATAYAAHGKPSGFPTKTTSLRDWANDLPEHAGSEFLASEADYWERLNLLHGELPKNNYPVLSSTEIVQVVLNREKTGCLLKKVSALPHTRIEDFLLTALALTLRSWTKRNEWRVNVVGSAREAQWGELNLSRTAGNFDFTYPIKLSLRDQTPGEAFSLIQQRLGEIPNGGAGYELLRYLSKNRSVKSGSEPDLCFRYEGNEALVSIENSFFESVSEFAPENIHPHVLEVSAVIQNDTIVMNWRFRANHYYSKSIESLAEAYRNQLERLIDQVPISRAENFLDIKGPIDAVVNAQIFAKRTVGAVVNIFRDGSRVSWNYGAPKEGVSERLRDDSVFQIGSVTKTFTGILLAEAILNGHVSVETKISDDRLIPELLKTSVSEVTLRQLVTHTSGLPSDEVSADRYYSAEEIIQFLSPPFQLDKAPSLFSRVRYTSLGVAILGLALERIHHRPYGDLVRDIICHPLGMFDTGLHANESQIRRMVQPYNQTLQEIPVRQITGINIGESGLFSTANDLLRYVLANLNPPDSPLGKAIRLSHQILAPGVPESVGMTWFLGGKGGASEIWHTGSSGGTTCLLAFDPNRNLALVALGISSYLIEYVEEIVFGKGYSVDLGYFLTGEQRSQITGKYDFGEGKVFNVQNEKNILFCTGHAFPHKPPRARLTARSELEFSFFEGLGTLSFIKSESGEVTNVSLSTRGKKISGKKMTAENRGQFLPSGSLSVWDA